MLGTGTQSDQMIEHEADAVAINNWSGVGAPYISIGRGTAQCLLTRFYCKCQSLSQQMIHLPLPLL